MNALLKSPLLIGDDREARDLERALRVWQAGRTKILEGRPMGPPPQLGGGLGVRLLEF